ncbi:unnamed protein product [Clonostachys byssicola]|uniref:F-box domain-containing protein n=1 Tax=Clonostachys byssicola TaxID=160290 RepID=A0A9N9U814_9HYPO|nr:unnamed protein product [Clonostachys byssicola]
MSSSLVHSRTQRVLVELEKSYATLQDVNEELRIVQADIYLASFKWNVLSCGLESSDRPEYWANTSGRSIWSFVRDEQKLKEWISRVHRGDLVSGDLLQLRESERKELQGLGDIKRDLEGIQHQLRQIINILSRPGLRSYNILDMPEEILCNIFEFVEDFPWEFHELWHFASKDIKNCRLTCQAFNRISSRFFLHSVPVGLTASSLSRFNEISSHPTISKGVHCVRAILRFYDTSLGDSLRAFILHNANMLRDRVQSIEEMKSWRYQKDVSEETGVRIVESLKEALACWHRVASDTQAQSLDDQDHPHLELLKATHERYQSLCAYQDEMWQSGRFLQAVATGVSRMPGAKAIFFHDWDLATPMRSSFYHSQDINEPLSEFMLQPMNYLTASDYRFRLRLCDMIAKLLVAVHHAGAWLERIDIRLSYVEFPSDLMPSPELRQQLPLAMQRLREFNFKCEGGFNGELTQDILYNIVGSCLDTGSLRKISIDMSSREPDKLCVGRVITSRHWQHLSKLFLYDVSFHFSELQLFVSRAPRSFSCAVMRCVYLLSGTWAEVLDTLREKPSIDDMVLTDPLGAECEDMSDEEMKRIFGRAKPLAPSQAELYILRQTSQNPLRDQQSLDQDAVDVESEDEMEAEQ